MLDTVQHRKNYFQNRNRIKVPNGSAWFTLPVNKPVVVPIREIRVGGGSQARTKFLNLIRSNSERAPYFGSYFPGIEEIVLTESETLSEINIELIRFCLDALEIRTERVAVPR